MRKTLRVPSDLLIEIAGGDAVKARQVLVQQDPQASNRDDPARAM